MKLGNRLKQLDSMVEAGYEHIWDCCCDHGLLGARLLERDVANQTVHFVDIVPRLIDTLNTDLEKFYPKEANDGHTQWQTHCLDTALLPLTNYYGNHLIIIAGVGGDLTARFIQALVRNNPSAQLDFLLCPVHHQYELREGLIELGMGLVSESLIVENKRYYEALLARATGGDGENQTRTLTNVGEDIWACNDVQQIQTAQNYLKKTIAHYKRKSSACIEDTTRIIADYEAVIIRPSD